MASDHIADGGHTVIESAVTFSEQEAPFFKKLPAEIRNYIYELTIDDESISEGERAYFGRNAKLCTCLRIARVNRQVRSEFMPVLCVKAESIYTAVRNFNFEHVGRFLDSLTDSQVTALRNDEDGPTLHCDLILPSSDEYGPTNNNLDKWLTYVCTPENPGYQMYYTYEWRYDFYDREVYETWCSKIDDMKDDCFYADDLDERYNVLLALDEAFNGALDENTERFDADQEEDDRLEQEIQEETVREWYLAGGQADYYA